MKKLCQFSKSAIPFLLVAIGYLIFRLHGGGCPFAMLLGVPCPTCGMVGALLSLVVWDIDGYFAQNAMALPCALSLGFSALAAYTEKRVLYIVPISVFSLNLIYYFIRLCGV